MEISRSTKRRIGITAAVIGFAIGVGVIGYLAVKEAQKRQMIPDFKEVMAYLTGNK